MKSIKNIKAKKGNPWGWIPTLYMAEGIPYVIVMSVATIMYERLGLSNAQIALYTSWLYLPWVIKPFWSPIVELFETKHWWIVMMQMLIGAALGGLAFSLEAPNYIQWSLAMLWIMAFSSATHDIAADGFYMLALDDQQQAFFVGIRSTFYRIASIIGQGLLIMFAGTLESRLTPSHAWSITFALTALLFFAFFAFHAHMLPKTEADKKQQETDLLHAVKDFFGTFVSFFRKKHIVIALLFILCYRLPEAMLVKYVRSFYWAAPKAEV